MNKLLSSVVLITLLALAAFVGTIWYQRSGQLPVHKDSPNAAKASVSLSPVGAAAAAGENTVSIAPIQTRDLPMTPERRTAAQRSMEAAQNAAQAAAAAAAANPASRR